MQDMQELMQPDRMALALQAAQEATESNMEESSEWIQAGTEH